MVQLFQVDAFTNVLYSGNPAAVCLLDHWITEGEMQNIAAENNLAETAFVVKTALGYAIRWFTPTVEVALCGHATLAAAHVLFKECNIAQKQIEFSTQKSGVLTVTQLEDWYEMDFPCDQLEEYTAEESLLKAFNVLPLASLIGKTDVLLVFKTQEEIETLSPIIRELRKIDARGVIVTAPGNSVDFVSRFFAPNVGVEEDPVTGSAHTTLVPYWSAKLGKKELSAKQISTRGGELKCTLQGSRVKIQGQAITYLRGDIALQGLP